MRLQPIFMEVIDRDQIAFLPLKFILDNVILMNGTIDYAWHINQPLVFAKAYDKVNSYLMPWQRWECLTNSLRW